MEDRDIKYDDRKKHFLVKRRCRICRGKQKIDYKDIELLKQFVTASGKIVSQIRTGNCAKHQRRITRAIKRARILAFLPFTR